MSGLGRYFVALAVATIVLAGVGQVGAEILQVNDFGGVFDRISVSEDGRQFTLEEGKITTTFPDTLPEQLEILDVTVDLTGYDDLGSDDLQGGTVGIVGGSLTIRNPSNMTEASLGVTSATLTQVLNSPIGIGFASLVLNLSSSNLKTADDKTINLGVIQAAISLQGLQVTTDGTDGTASAPVPASASISAIPEPSTFLLGLLAVVGCGGYCWRRRGRRFS